MKRGVALPLALFALALASALSVGGLYVARELAKSAHVSQRGAELEPIAEAVLATAVADWDSATRASQRIGTTASLETNETDIGRAAGWVTRTSETEYWLASESVAMSKPLLRRRLGIVVRQNAGRPEPIPHRAWAQLP